jgi:hypothetical protein
MYTFDEPRRFAELCSEHSIHFIMIKNIENNASTATTLGIMGIIIGALGLIAGGFALARKSRLATAEQPARESTLESLQG